MRDESSPRQWAILRRLRDRIQFAARQFVPGRGESDEHIRRICEERATKPWDKVTAAQRVALLLASGGVAPRSQPHWRGCSLVAPSQKPRATQQTVFYPGVSSVNAAIPMGLASGPGPKNVQTPVGGAAAPPYRNRTFPSSNATAGLSYTAWWRSIAKNSSAGMERTRMGGGGGTDDQ